MSSFWTSSGLSPFSSLSISVQGNATLSGIPSGPLPLLSYEPSTITVTLFPQGNLSLGSTTFPHLMFQQNLEETNSPMLVEPMATVSPTPTVTETTSTYDDSSTNKPTHRRIDLLLQAAQHVQDNKTSSNDTMIHEEVIHNNSLPQTPDTYGLYGSETTTTNPTCSSGQTAFITDNDPTTIAVNQKSIPQAKGKTKRKKALGPRKKNATNQSCGQPRVTRSTTILTSYSNNDVLCGRGCLIAKHPGNLQFRSLVWQARHDYAKAKRRDRLSIAKQVLAKIEALQGRFLEKDAHGIFTRVVSNERALEKTSQALRERKWDG